MPDRCPDQRAAMVSIRKSHEGIPAGGVIVFRGSAVSVAGAAPERGLRLPGQQARRRRSGRSRERHRRGSGGVRLGWRLPRLAGARRVRTSVCYPAGRRPPSGPGPAAPGCGRASIPRRDAQAEQEFRDVLAARLRVLGPDHPDTRITRDSLVALKAGSSRRLGSLPIKSPLVSLCRFTGYARAPPRSRLTTR